MNTDLKLLKQHQFFRRENSVNIFRVGQVQLHFRDTIRPTRWNFLQGAAGANFCRILDRGKVLERLNARL